MMKMERKAKVILEAYQNKYEEEIRIETVIKDNDTKYLAFIVGDSEKSHMRIRMEGLIDNTKSVEEIVEFIHQSYIESPFKAMENFTSRFLDFENVKENLFVKLLNTEKNKERLENIVHKPWYNLSMVLCIHTILPDGRIGAIQASKELMNYWKKSVDEVFEIALLNAEEKFPMQPKSLTKFIIEMEYPFLSEKERKDICNEILKGEKEFAYICRNEDAISAAGFLYPSNLKMLQPGDYIIPSSMEECLIVKTDVLSIEEVVNMVKNINADVVEEEIFLADNMYEYAGNGKFIVH